MIFVVVYCLCLLCCQYREQRQQAQMSNPHYLKPAKASSKKKRGREETAVTLDVSSIPVSRLELGVDLVIGQSLSHDMHVMFTGCGCHTDDPKTSPLPAKKSKKGKKGKKGKRRRKGEDVSSEEERAPRPQVNVSHGELPDGALASDAEEEEEETLDEVSKALNQNLDM